MYFFLAYIRFKQRKKLMKKITLQIMFTLGIFFLSSHSFACVGYTGPGGPCSTGPGGGLSTGPGGGLSTGPGGGLSTGPNNWRKVK
jgi:hypothetical protein